MGRSEIMALGTIFKAIIILGCFAWAMSFLIRGLVKKDNSRLKKAALILIGSWITVVILATIEFVILSET